MNIAILNLDDMKAITGANTKARMLEVLIENDIPHFVKADGWPVTTADAINGTLLKRRLSAPKPHSITARPESVPGFRLPQVGLA